MGSNLALTTIKRQNYFHTVATKYARQVKEMKIRYENAIDELMDALKVVSA